jgi:DNA-binding response OmpR family regulator
MISSKGIPTVLVVEDDRSLRDLVVDALRFAGYTVDSAANGSDAIESVERRIPSLILLDMRMPVMDGWTFSRELRRRGFASSIVVMTAAQSASTWADEAQAAAFLEKPFELGELIATVESVLTEQGYEVPLQN